MKMVRLSLGGREGAGEADRQRAAGESSTQRLLTFLCRWFSPPGPPILLASRVLVGASTMLTQGHTLSIKKKKKTKLHLPYLSWQDLWGRSRTDDKLTPPTPCPLPVAFKDALHHPDQSPGRAAGGRLNLGLKSLCQDSLWLLNAGGGVCGGVGGVGGEDWLLFAFKCLPSSTSSFL